MPIKLRTTCQPLALNPDLQAPFAESDTYRRLLREMELYVDGRTNGGSFLVAGHRGSGKTWLAHKAIERLQFFESAEPDPKRLTRWFPRPFLVRLHGPDLLAFPEDVEEVSESRQGCLGGVATREQRGGRGLALHAMSEIGLALHRALCEEFSHSYIEHASETSKKLVQPQASESHELAAQFQIELDQSPSDDRLLKFWEEIGKTEDGVLRRPSTKPRGGEHHLRDPLKQGFKELVALTTAFHLQAEIARHRLRGPKGADHHPQSSRQEEKERESPWSSLGRFLLGGGRLINHVFGLVIGGVVFVALMEAHVHLAVSLLTAFMSAVSTTVLLNFASSYESRSTFLPEHTTAALDRTLPLFVRRIREAGLHPIFVVDELDKVDSLDEKLQLFMKSLKFFVTEQAFFCFLVDRSYFNQLMARRLQTPYALEDRFFSEMALVDYSPTDLNGYLDGLLAGNSEPHSLLKRLLLFRSRMHLGDLDRVLSQLISEGQGRGEGEQEKARQGTTSASTEKALGATVLLNDEAILQNEGYRLAVFYQLCVELAVLSEDLQSRLRQDPDVIQEIYDALYYPAHCWESGKRTLAGPSSFLDYLRKRHSLSEEGTSGSRQQPLWARRTSDSSEVTGLAGVTDPDFRLLETEMQNLLSMLEDPNRLRKRIGDRFAAMLQHWDPSAKVNNRTPSALRSQAMKSAELKKSPAGWEAAERLDDLYREFVRLGGRIPPVARREGTDYIWIRDQYGRSIAYEVSESIQQVKAIKALAVFLHEATAGKCGVEDLADRYFLIGASPSWRALQPALERYEEVSRDSQVDSEEPALITAFGRMLQDFGIVLRPGLFYAILCATTVETVPATFAQTFLVGGLEVLTARVRLRADQTAAERAQFLDSAYEDDLKGIFKSLDGRTARVLENGWKRMSRVNARSILEWIPILENILTAIRDQPTPGSF